MSSQLSIHHNTGVEIRSYNLANANQIGLTFKGKTWQENLEITAFDLPKETTDALLCALPAHRDYADKITPPTPLDFTKMVVKRFGKPDPVGPFEQEKGMAETLLATAFCDSLGNDHPLAQIIMQFRAAEAAHLATNNQYSAELISDYRDNFTAECESLGSLFQEYIDHASQVEILTDDM